MTSLSDDARRHLWMHFTRLGLFDDHDVPVISRGDIEFVGTLYIEMTKPLIKRANMTAPMTTVYFAISSPS